MKRRARKQAQFSALYVAVGIAVLVLSLQSWLAGPADRSRSR